MIICKNILLLIIALLLANILLPIGFLYTLVGIIFFQNNKATRLEKYLFEIAVNIDQMGNTVMAYLFDDVLIHKGNGIDFGNPDETISSVLGKNQQSGKQKWPGKLLDRFLNALQKNHSIKAIEKNIESGGDW